MKQPTHRNPDTAELLTIAQAAGKLNLGTQKTRQLAAEAEAVLKFGRCYRVDMAKLMRHVRSCYTVD